jgi:hypothetical protein
MTEFCRTLVADMYGSRVPHKVVIIYGEALITVLRHNSSLKADQTASSWDERLWIRKLLRN